MPLRSFMATIAKALGIQFSDNFNRTTSGSLGTASGGGVWSAIRGTWSANGTKGTSADAASTYPIATYDMGSPNVTIDVDTTQGTGAAFWVSDTQNWWGMYPWQATVTSYTADCTGYTSSCSGYTSSCTQGWYCAQDVCTAYGPTCSGYGCSGYAVGYISAGQYAKVCSSYSCTAYAKVCTGYACSFYDCLGYGQVCTYSAACTYTKGSSTSGGTVYLRLVKSVTNTVTTVVDQAVTAAIASIRVIVSNGTITGKAYSSAGQVTQTGSDLVNTPTTPTTANKHGIILAPGGYSQGNTVDNITMLS